ncbi:hypothetical protein ANCDUO_04090 [Ancylostoma duodenale]|uniref:Uncharacterized protein n=1 Tax=Ancylostoma duodenale TaxID=51022 RepID=A0A0C2H1W9_9BILA|nr:hypothetical protein ANCDUO_04090 [Ancylostoma duodenale]
MNESMSTTNMQAIEVVPVVAAGVVFGTLVAIGTIATAIFIAVLIRARRKFAEGILNAYVSLLFQIGDDTPRREWYIWGSRILELTEQASLYFALLMTINRFVVFVVPQLLFAFTRTRTMIMCFLMWVYIIFIVTWNLTKLTSMITPYLKETDSWVQWCWTIFSYSTSILNQMVNPFLFLTMNKMVRHVLRHFFKRGSDGTSESGDSPKTDPTITGFRRKISRALLKSKRILLNNQPIDRSTWVI